MQQIHGTCVACHDTAILLRGPSGSGKSDLALRLIDGGAVLVADDRVDLSHHDGGLYASPPEALAGLLEVRGLGIFRLPHLREAAVRLVIDLVAPQAVDRYPDPRRTEEWGLDLPLYQLTAFEASAAAKVRLAARAVTGFGDGALLLPP